MPEWLLGKDQYTPQKDKDTFIDKSILSILGVISKLALQSEKRKKKNTINPVLKVISTLLVIILISVTRSFTFVLTINVLLLLAVSLMSLKQIKSILSVSFITALFTLIILLPSILMGNVGNSILTVIKVLANITSVSILTNVTEWSDITGILKLFFIPDLFIFVLDITIKYISVLGEFSLDMLYSLKLRSVGRNKNKYSSISGIMGTMFIKSKEMAEEMHGAMECRGFTGEYKAYKKYTFNYMDFIYLIINVIMVVIYLYLR